MSQKPDWLVTHGTPWRKGPPRPIYDNPWISLTEYDAVAPTGADALYGVVSFKNFAVAILPVHDDGTITLVGQSRLPCGDYSWEIPEGGGPLDDDPQESAKRELLEETGLAAANWQEILRMQLSNSVTDEQAFGYLATGLTQVQDEPQGDGTEDILRARVPFREALAAAVGGYMRDALTVAMLLRGYHMAREGALPSELSAAMLG
jgi:8-oxo-dGTP pyrophosphatase MutT (NUDIX family)